LSYENHPELIALTNETAGSGTHSLKIQDLPGLKARWNPHLYWDPNWTEGTGHLFFKIRAGAEFNCEWRNNANPYRTGSSIVIKEKTLWSRSQKLIEIKGRYLVFH
jgi:hypothetical protein